MVEREDTCVSSSIEEGDAQLHVTRRGFLAGSVASALFAEKVLAGEVTDRNDRWLYSRIKDGTGRYIFSLSYFGTDGQSLVDLYFRELAFGALARIDVEPAGVVDDETGRIDLRLRISGATMLPEGPAELSEDESRFFTLEFGFHHNSRGGQFAPTIEAKAQGWGFGDDAVLLATQSLFDWIKGDRQAIRVNRLAWKPKDAAGKGKKISLPNGLLSSVFGSLVGSSGPELYFRPQMAPGDRFVWRLVADGASQAFTLSTRALDAVSKQQDASPPTIVARASSLDIWREAPPLSDEKVKVPEASKPQKVRAGWVEDTVIGAKPLSSIVRGEFGGAVGAESTLVLAGKDFPDGSCDGVSFTVLDQPALTLPIGDPDRHETVELARWGSVNDATEKGFEVVAARAFLSGDLNIVSRPVADKPGPQFTEGPLPIELGQLCLSRTLTKPEPGQKQSGGALEGPLTLVCQFPIAERTFTLATSLGAYSAQAPEPRISAPGHKRDRAPVDIRAQDFVVDYFEAAVCITDASVALLDSGATQPKLGATRGHFSRLDFHGGPEIALRLHGVGKPATPQVGYMLLGTTNGLALPVEPDGHASSLPMETALLRVLRYGDLADLRFRFKGLDLVNDGTSCVLRPRGPAISQTGNTAPEPPPPIEGAPAAPKDKGAAGDQGTQDDQEKPDPRSQPLTDEGDPRPMIIVEFPPQHRAEQAFFQLRTVRPGLPKLPAKARQTSHVAEALHELHRSYAADASAARMQQRANILHWLIQEAAKGKDKEWWKNEWKDLASELKPLAVPADKLELDNDQDLERQIRDFLTFADKFAGRFQPREPKQIDDINTPPANFPAEQKLYAGPEFLDPDTLRYAEQARDALDKSTFANGNPLLDKVPANPVSEAELAALEQNLGVPPDKPAEQLSPDENKNKEQAAQQAKALRELRSPGYSAFSDKYNELVVTVGYPDGSKLPLFNGADDLRWIVLDIYRKLVEESDEAKREDGKKRFAAWWDKISPQLDLALKKLPQSDTGEEPPVRPVQSRLSGPTRLAFHINTDDYQDEFATGAIPFTVNDLTNFSRFELSVVRRAQKLFLSHLDGTRRPVWDSEIDQDFAHILTHQEFSRGGAGIEPPDARRKEGEEPGLVEPPNGRWWEKARVTVDQRLAEVVARSSAAPTDRETAIEMPFRLMLSPSQDALFRTPRGVPTALYGPPKDADNVPDSGASALWTAELDPESKADTRAIWSPDFRPEAFLPQEPRREGLWADLLKKSNSTLPEFITRYFPKKLSRVNRAPLRGPYAPWAMGKHISSLSLTDEKGELEAHRFRTSLDAFDRHELVALTSVHGLPVLGRVSMSGTRLGKDQREPPPGFQVSLMGKPAEPNEPYDLSDIYVPRPLDPLGLELALSSLGGFLSVNAAFEPPASIIDYERGTLFDALSIEHWRHRIVLGRDISAEVVYKGYLMPFGIRASLIKSTERRFERIGGKGGPVAVLRQRMFIRVAKRPKEFGAFRQPDDGRRVPFRNVRMLTLQTPDIVDPFDLAGNRDDTGVWPGGLIDLVERSPKLGQNAKEGTPFWPRTARRAGAEVMFEVMLDDKIRLRMPMVFVDNVTVNRNESLKTLVDYYNLHGLPLDKLPVAKEDYAPYVARAALVQRPLFNQKLIFAPPENDGDTEFETESLTFAVEGGRMEGYTDAQNGNPESYQPSAVNQNFKNNPYLNGADQPPFYPAMRRATVHVKQIERLTGQSNVPVVVGFDSTYALSGFDPPPPKQAQPAEPPKKKNRSDIFLALLKPLPMRFGNEGQRGGAVARPAIDVVALSRSRGPIGSKDAAAETESPSTTAPATGPENQLPEIPPAAHAVKDAHLADFFGGNAKLLGIVKISDLLQVLGTLFDLEPKLREIREFGGGVADDADAFIRDSVLIPLRDALKGFADRLENLTFDGEPGLVALKKIYPDVSQTMEEFVALLDRAISAAPPSTDTDAIIELYSSVYATGRRFAQAVERATRDPLTPLREAIRGLVTGFVDQLKAIVTDVTGNLLETFRPEKIRGFAIDFLQQQLLVHDGATTALANVIIRLPLPDSKTLGDDAQKIVDKACADTLSMAPDQVAEGGQKSPWSVKPDLPIFDLGTFAVTFFDKLKAQAKDNADLKAWAEKEEKAAQASLEGLQGALWKRFDEIVVTKLSQATRALADVSKLSIEKVVQALEDVGATFADGFAELEGMSEIALSWKEKCTQLLEIADGFARVIFPSVVDDPKACIGTKAERNWIACNDPATFPPFYRMVGAVARLADALEALGDSNAGMLKTLIDKAKNKFPSDQAVEAALEPLDQLKRKISEANGAWSKDVRDVRDRLLSIAHDFNELQKRYRKAYQDAAKLCEEPAKLVRSLSNALAALERQRTEAIDQVMRLANLLNAGLAAVWPAQDAGIPAVTRPSTSVEPAINGDPKDWAWSGFAEAEISTSNDALYFIETAKKDILAAMLRPVTLSAAFLADTTALAALLTVKAEKAAQAFDKQRDDARTALRDALAKVQIKTLEPFFASLSATLKKETGTEFQKTLAKLTEKIGTEIGSLQAVDVLIATLAEPNFGAGAIDARRADLHDYLASRMSDLKQGVFSVLIDAANDQIDMAALGLENQVLGLLSRIFGGANLKLEGLLKAVQKPLAAIASTTAGAFEQVLAKRNSVIDSLPQASAALNASLTTLLVACPGDASKTKDDLLAVQTAALRKWAKEITDEAPGSETLTEAASGFLEQMKVWSQPANLDAKSCKANGSDGPNAVIVIFQQVKDAIDTVIRGEFGRLIDIGAVRREVEARLKNLIPTRLTLAYDFDVELKQSDPAEVFIPNFSDPDHPDSVVSKNYNPEFDLARLTLKARTYVDLLKPAPPKVDVSGSIGAFKIKLVGNMFDVLTLQFDGARFGSDTGGKLKTNVTDFKLGEMVAFLDSISQWVSFGENGFFLALRWDLPGIEAGYRMPPIYLTLGGLNISNVSLNASCVLPFSDGSALFKVGLSRPEAPFSITSTIFGGCGHLALYANPSGIVGFSASLEFGAIVDFKLGPVTGMGRITAGIYIRSIDMGGKRVSTVEGVFTAAGSAKIAMFSMMAMLQVRVGQQASGGVAGHAIFVFSFSLGIKDIEFRFVIFKKEGKGFSGGGMTSPSGSLESPTRFASAGCDCPASRVANSWEAWSQPAEHDAPRTDCHTTCKSENFAGYMKHFSEVRPWILS